MQEPDPPIPLLSGILETSLYVEDLDRSEAFYRRIFGFETLFRDDRMRALLAPGQGVLLLFRKGGSLRPSTVPGGVIPPHGGDGALHLCFAIPVSEREAWALHLQRHGVPLESRVIQTFGGTSLYFRDPDGHSLEVATPGLWKNY